MIFELCYIEATTPNKGSQTAIITRLSVNLCLELSGTRLLKNIPTRDASPPLVLAFLQARNDITKQYHKTLSQNVPIRSCVSLQRVSGNLFTIVGQLV